MTEIETIDFKNLVETAIKENIHAEATQLEALNDLAANNAKLVALLVEKDKKIDSLEKIIDDQDKEFFELLDYVDSLEGERSTSYHDSGMCGKKCCVEDASVTSTPSIRRIYYCDESGKEKVIVIFSDETKVIKEMVPGDHFDLNVGVALCVAERMYGGKTKFHKAVKKIISKNK